MLFNNKWNEKDTMDLSKRLSSLLESGIPLIEGMTIIKGYFRKDKKKQLEEVIFNIREGIALTEAFKPYQFPYPFFIMLGIAQMHGKLPETFAKLGAWFERKKSFRDQMIQKLTYPIFLLMFVIVLTLYFVLYLLPQFQEMLHGFDQGLPTITTALLRMQLFLQSHYVAIGSFIILAGFIIFTVFYIWGKKKKLLAIASKIPFVTRLLRVRYTYFFTAQLGLLLEAGMGLWEALIEMRKHTQGQEYELYIKEIEEQILSGVPLSKIELSAPLLHTEFFIMTSLGEQLGTLGAQLIICSELMEERIESQVHLVLKWVEPIVLLTLGVIILLVILSLFLPILQIIQSI